jgi:hypothetical protein
MDAAHPKFLFRPPKILFCPPEKRNLDKTLY